jgi:hypothetical protein
MKRLVVLAALVLVGCGSTAATVNGSALPVTPVSAPWTAAFAQRALAWLQAQPPYHQSGWHNGILLSSGLNSVGNWSGAAIEPDGTFQVLAAEPGPDSQEAAMLVRPGDEIEFAYHNATFLTFQEGGPKMRVLKVQAVQP